MVLNYYWLLSLVVSISVPLFLFLFRKHRAYPNLPPGRLGWPVIGESLAFQSAIKEGRPEKFFFDRAGPDGAAFKTSLLGEPTVVLCGAVGNKFVFSNEDKLVTLWFPPSLVKLFSLPVNKSAGTVTRPVRKLLLGVVKIDALRRSVGVMDEVGRRHFAAEWGGIGGESVIVARLAKRYTFRVAVSLFASIDDPEEIERWEEPFDKITAAMFSIPINLPGTVLNRALKAIKVMREEVVKAVKRRKAELAEGKADVAQDFLSHMLVTRSDDGQLYGEMQIANYIISLFQATHGNISTVCFSVVKCLAELPLVYEAVYIEQMTIAKSKAEGEALNWDDLQNMKYSWNVAQEVLRITSPASGTFRVAITDFTFGGFSIPKGWKIFWSANATHKNPTYFPDPDKFDPTRFEGSGPAPHTFIPFGGGIRMCPGIEYAKVKILVFMHNLVKHCPWDKIVLN